MIESHFGFECINYCVTTCRPCPSLGEKSKYIQIPIRFITRPNERFFMRFQISTSVNTRILFALLSRFNFHIFYLYAEKRCRKFKVHFHWHFHHLCHKDPSTTHVSANYSTLMWLFSYFFSLSYYDLYLLCKHSNFKNNHDKSWSVHVALG